MELKLNVYDDCTSEKPIKTYVVRRLTFKTAKRLGALQEESKTSGNEKQEEITFKMFKEVIPDFDEADLDGLDPVEVGEFFKALGNGIAQVVETAKKN